MEHSQQRVLRTPHRDKSSQGNEIPNLPLRKRRSILNSELDVAILGDFEVMFLGDEMRIFYVWDTCSMCICGYLATQRSRLWQNLLVVSQHSCPPLAHRDGISIS